MNDLPHTVWLREGSWRVLSCYRTRADAMDCVRNLKAQGERVRYTLAGSAADLALRGNVHQQ